MYLKALGHICYPEVECAKGDPIADIVCVRRKGHQVEDVGVVEVKTSLSLRLVRQACWWQEHADWAGLALPAPKGPKNRDEREKCYGMLQRLGLGLWEVPADGQVELILRPLVVTGRSEALRQKLKPEHQQLGKAGSARAERFTPFQQTREAMRRVLRDSYPVEGCGLKELLRESGHHYPTDQKAISSLRGYLTGDGIRGIRCEQHQGKLVLFYKPTEEEGGMAA